MSLYEPPVTKLSISNPNGLWDAAYLLFELDLNIHQPCFKFNLHGSSTKYHLPRRLFKDFYNKQEYEKAISCFPISSSSVQFSIPYGTYSTASTCKQKDLDISFC